MLGAAEQRVYDLLTQMPSRGLDAAKELFWTELNYDRARELLSQRSWTERTQAALAEPPMLLARCGVPDQTFDILYVKLSSKYRGRDFPLSITAERLVINELLKNHLHALFLFSDASERYWHLVNVRYEKGGEKRRVFRRITVGPDERLRTAAERVAMLDAERAAPELWGLSPLAMQQQHDEAFNVEKVTDEFFRAYEGVFRSLQGDLQRQTDDPRWAHDFALQFLNRLMFLYYVQRKRWLWDNADFLGQFWRSYQSGKHARNSFAPDWLNVLFFEAFNNRFQAGRADRQYFPDDIRQAMAMAPFLNGGLFQRNDLDAAYSPAIADRRFQQIFDFFESYNFTISEDTPLDQEVAVDPEMIGKVYESLVNVSDTTDERGEAGIFYTPRVEIDLMCRLALVDWLNNHVGAEHRDLLYETVFAFDPGDKEDADHKVAAQALWPKLDDLLRSITVVDPACGSGSFLVGMLYVLDDLLARAGQQLGVQQQPYERKKQIIANSLYGVDVMDWAVHVAELRLWLQLVIESDLPREALKIEPLLPNLSFNVRPGDSLVQEVGGINMALRHGTSVISPAVKRRITELKKEKLKFYQSAPDRKYTSDWQIRQAELGLFREVLDSRQQHIAQRIKEVDSMLEPRTNLFGEMQAPQMEFNRLNVEAERERLVAEREQVGRAREALRSAKDVPFVWDIAFVEVLESERRGFDIVIGNPPYVRQERIHDPTHSVEEATVEQKRVYKDKLARSVYASWPMTFGYNWTKDKATWRLDAKSDLYTYFYFHGLSLLSEKGAFCFITSNSWLDVGYGRGLQEFLLTRGKVRLVIDNQARRSFASADVNTVIVLLGAPLDARRQRPQSLEHTARFVMLKVPFEEVLDPVIWQEVDESSARCTRPEHRTFALLQSTLLANGMDPEKESYAADKWGGKYLRAPDIYWTILEKGQKQLVRLGDIATVRRGYTTGCNEFFYLDEQRVAEWGIEPEFLQPIVKSPRECKRILVHPRELRYRLFMCHKNKRELRGTAALEYIKWGESRGYQKRPTCRGRARWWDLGQRPAALLNVGYLIGEVVRFFACESPIYVSDNFHEVHVDPHLLWTLAVSGNSTLTQMMANITGRANFGDGLMKIQTYEMADLSVVGPVYLDTDSCRLLVANADRLDLGAADRHKLDPPVFDALGLTGEERQMVYTAVANMVNIRLKKAESLQRRVGKEQNEEA